MFMKGQQLSAKVDALTELQVTQNNRLAMAWVGTSAKQKKILKMKEDPTICMKTQGHMTKCHSQFCGFEGVRRELAVFARPLTVHRPSALHGCFRHFHLTFPCHSSAAKPEVFHFDVAHPFED